MAMVAPAAISPQRPAQAAFRRHVLERCRFGGNSWRCQLCFDLYRQASAEDWRRREAASGSLTQDPPVATTMLGAGTDTATSSGGRLTTAACPRPTSNERRKAAQV